MKDTSQTLRIPFMHKGEAGGFMALILVFGLLTSGPAGAVPLAQKSMPEESSSAMDHQSISQFASKAGKPLRPSVNPIVSGIAKTSRYLSVDTGTWGWNHDVGPFPGFQPFEFQWYQCKKAVKKPTSKRPKSCNPVPGSNQYLIKLGDNDNNNYMVAQIFASTTEGHSSSVFTKSSRLVTKLKATDEKVIAIDPSNRGYCATTSLKRLICWGTHGLSGDSILPRRVQSDVLAFGGTCSLIVDSAATSGEGRVSCSSPFQNLQHPFQNLQHAGSELIYQSTGDTWCSLSGQSGFNCWGGFREYNGNRPWVPNLHTTQKWVDAAWSTGHFCGIAADATRYCNTPHSDGPWGNQGYTHVEGSNDVICSIRIGGKLDCDSMGYAMGRQIEVSDSLRFFEPATSIAVSDVYACWTKLGGDVYCFGGRYDGEPQKIDGVSNATQIAMRDDSWCVLAIDGTVSCWGRNAEGQMGNGTLSNGDDIPQEIFGLFHEVTPPS